VLAQWQSSGLLIRRFRVRAPGAPPAKTQVTGRRALPVDTQLDIRAATRAATALIGPPRLALLVVVVLPEHAGHAIGGFARDLRSNVAVAVLRSRRRLQRRWPGVGAGLSLSRGRPGHTRQQANMIRPDHRHARGYSTQPSSSAPIVQLAVTASRSPCGRRCAIGNAEPRHSDHSHGISAYEEAAGEVGSGISRGRLGVTLNGPGRSEVQSSPRQAPKTRPRRGVHPS
jgi:hypothetical protein